MQFLKKLKHKTIALCTSPKATWWLAIISFIESSFFPIPADVLFAPMVILQKYKAYFFALIATVFSCLGGIFGYYIGVLGYEHFALPILEALGKVESFNYYRTLIHDDFFILWFFLLSSGFTHIPPIKVVTILSGVSGINFWWFLLSAIIGRGGRFFILAWLLKKYGDDISILMNKYMKQITVAVIIFLIGYIGYKIWI
jgi:membrane protein YqaA with SNARE-associated domain